MTTLVHPKFFWKSICPGQARSKASSDNTLYVAPQHIELLDIVRILTPTDVKRDTYPFVKQQSSFLISTNGNEEFMFEAKNTEERNRFLFAMKLMIARLASKIIVGDRDVFTEFFSASGLNMDSDDEIHENGIKEEQEDDAYFQLNNLGA